MKRLVFVFIFLLLPISAHALQLERLVKFPTSTIGTKIGVLPAILDEIADTTIALQKGAYVEAAAHALMVPLIAYNPALGLTASTVLGFTANCAFNVENAYNDGPMRLYGPFSDWLASLFPISGPEPEAGSLLTPADWHPEVAHVNDCSCSIEVLSSTQTSNSGCGNTAPKISCPCSNGVGWEGDFPYSHKVAESPCYGTNPWHYKYNQILRIKILPNPDTNNWPNTEGVPATITPTQAGEIASKAAEKAKNDPNFKKSLDDFIAENPKYLDTPKPITKSDIQNWYTTNNQTINNEYINNLEELHNQYPDDTTIALALEKAKADAQKEEETPQEETFNDIPISAFTPPYDPGPFDIPARFTSFLNNVKSSGLFSFSSSFFNSLPDGGSPIYEIDGGETFGHHTIDLSETLSVGLAVLKTVLLAAFGFLSIRAIIMKR
ncbi:MAG: hypothetical protein AB7U29_16560 [Desulfobulbus sp.]